MKEKKVKEREGERGETGVILIEIIRGNRKKVTVVRDTAWLAGCPRIDTAWLSTFPPITDEFDSTSSEKTHYCLELFLRRVQTIHS